MDARLLLKYELTLCLQVQCYTVLSTIINNIVYAYIFYTLTLISQTYQMQISRESNVSKACKNEGAATNTDRYDEGTCNGAKV